MTVDEQLREIAGRTVAVVDGKGDPRRSRSEILTFWANNRPKDAKAVEFADGVVGSLRTAPESSLRAPPFLLLQTVAVLLDVVSRPYDPEAGKRVMADPILILQGYVSSEDREVLRRLYRSPAEIAGRTLAYAGAAGLFGLGTGYVLSRLFGGKETE